MFQSRQLGNKKAQSSEVTLLINAVVVSFQNIPVYHVFRITDGYVHVFLPVLRIRIRNRIHRIHIFLGLLDPDPLVRGIDPDPDPLVRGIDPDPDPDPSIIKQKL
jgi:hypothetical protein